MPRGRAASRRRAWMSIRSDRSMPVHALAALGETARNQPLAAAHVEHLVVLQVPASPGSTSRAQRWTGEPAASLAAYRSAMSSQERPFTRPLSAVENAGRVAAIG